MAVRTDWLFSQRPFDSAQNKCGRGTPGAKKTFLSLFAASYRLHTLKLTVIFSFFFCNSLKSQCQFVTAR